MTNGVYAVGPSWFPLAVWFYWLFALTWIKHIRRAQRP